MEIRRFSLVTILIILLILGVSLILAISYESENFCIKKEIPYLTGHCEIGCCADEQGLEHNNYPKQKCINQDGKFYNGNCRNSFVCG